jgi:hypothetical protein
MYKIFNMGNKIASAINYSYSIAATLYSPETWFGSGA